MIITSETKATHRRASSAGVFKLKVKPEGDTRIVPSGSRLGTQPEPTTLVRDFILSFKELETYK